METLPKNESPRIPVGISECLLGQPVRYDGGHKRLDLATGPLADWFDYTPICPEMAIGLGTPRETIQLRRNHTGEVRLVAPRSGLDHTEAMTVFASDRAARLDHLCGYIFTKRSPSCGLERIAIHTPQGQVESREGMGLFARLFHERHPLVPVEEDGRLNDPRLRENFVMRVFVLWRWRSLCAAGLTVNGLVDFHTDHKYLLMAHHQQAYRELGRVVAAARRDNLDSQGALYIQLLMGALHKPANRRGHANVLMHLLGYFRHTLPPRHKQQFLALVRDYRASLLPLSAPMTLLKHFLAEHPDDYLERQVYLQPHPEALALRNYL